MTSGGKARSERVAQEPHEVNRFANLITVFGALGSRGLHASSSTEPSNDGEHIFRKVPGWFLQLLAQAFVLLGVRNGGGP